MPPVRDETFRWCDRPSILNRPQDAAIFLRDICMSHLRSAISEPQVHVGKNNEVSLSQRLSAVIDPLHCRLYCIKISNSYGSFKLNESQKERLILERYKSVWHSLDAMANQLLLDELIY